MRGMNAPNPWDEPPEPHPPAWSAAQAQAWRARGGLPSPWRAVRWQLAAGVVVVGLAGAWFDASVARSVAYGAGAAVVPSAVMALAMRGALMRAAQGHAAMSLMTLLAYEFLKVMLAVAILAMAPLWLESAHWLGVLVGLALTLKAPIAVIFFRKKRHPSEKQNNSN